MSEVSKTTDNREQAKNGESPEMPSVPAWQSNQIELQRFDGKTESLQRYEDHFARTENFDIRIGQDLAHTGKLHAASVIAAMQKKFLGAEPDEDITIIFATGKTQWQGLTELASMLENWESLPADDARLLAECGVDLEAKPDMDRVFATHLDTIFPQRRDAHFGYANELHNMFDKLGISQDKRLMFYGDVKDNGGQILDEPDNRLSEEEFKVIEASVQAEGIKIQEFLAGELDESHPQYTYIRDTMNYAQAVSSEIKSRGGADIQLFGAGGSYEGKGHAAFNERGTAFDTSVSMVELSHHAIAGNFKDNGGYHTAFAQNGEKAFAGLTLSFDELLCNPDCAQIVVITGKEKAENARSLTEQERSPDYPLTGMQQGGEGSALILEPMAAGSLRATRHPEDFRDISEAEWQGEIGDQFFVELARQTGVSLTELTPEQFLGGPGAGTAAIDLQREANLQALSRAIDWEEKTTALQRTIDANLIEPDDINRHLGLKGGDEILHIGPHLDDLSLAMQFLIDPMAAECEIDSYYTAPGYTAVPTAYALEVMDNLGSMSTETLSQIAEEASTEEGFRAAEERYLKALVVELKSAELNEDPTDFDCWKRFSKHEMDLRTNLLALYLNRRENAEDIYTTPEKIAAVTDVLRDCHENSTSWGRTEVELMQDIKVVLRFAEEQTELMGRGVDYKGIHFPISSSWYKTDKESTLASSDLEHMKNIIREKQPELLVVNGEGFMDHGAHSITEMTVKIAVKELLEAGELDSPPRLFMYRGVWDRNEVSGSENQVLVGLTEKMLQENDISFRANYRSQAPNPVPDGSTNEPEFFSNRVAANARHTKREVDSMLGVPTQYEGILAFDVLDLSDLGEASRFFQEVEALQGALDRSRDPIANSSLKRILGAEPPYANLSGEVGDKVLGNLREHGVRPDQVFSIASGEPEKLKLVL